MQRYGRLPQHRRAPPPLQPPTGKPHGAQLTGLQSRLLDCAAKLVRKGGTLIYCTCSLEPEEGEDRLARFLESNREFSRSPITPAELSGQSQFIDENGDLRTHPAKAIGPASGLDGFFAARLVRS